MDWKLVGILAHQIMIWIAPSEKDQANDTLEKRLWAAADQFRANSGLSAAQYSQPVLGLIFLRFAEVRFARQRAKLETPSPAAYHADGILFLQPHTRFDFLLSLPEATDIGGKVNDAKRDIEKHNPQLAGVLPKTSTFSPAPCSRSCSRKSPKFPPPRITTLSVAFTNTSSASSPAPRVRKAASSIRPAASFAS